MKIDIRTDRLNAGLSQQAFADKIGVTVDVIRYLEAGGRPHPRNAKIVADHYGLSVLEMWPEVDGDRESAAA